MPGLVGIISKQGPEDCERNVRTMLAAMQYEDFYNSGIFIDQERSVYVGWTCHRNSFCDCLPVTSKTKNLLLFFVGEFFDIQHQSTAKENNNNVNNPRYLIHLYEEESEKSIEKLNGWFFGLLLDTRCNKVFLFNDRYGMHRIFIHESKDGFYFSSEAKALLSVLPEAREFDPNGLGEFLTCGCTLGRRSLYKNVDVLPSGSLWTFEDGKVETKVSYFDHGRWFEQQHLDDKKFLPHFVEFFRYLVKAYSGGPLPVGISLTGGLDSRMIMACLDTRASEFPCYTFGSMYRDTFDVQIAREVAKACGQSHHVLVLDKEFLQGFPGYLEKAVYISDGYIGLSGAAELYVNSLARDLAPVRLTGNYGGELLRGVHSFKTELPRTEFVRPELYPFLKEAQTTFREIEMTDAVTFTLFHQAPSQGYGRLNVERSQLILRTPFMDNELVRLIYQSPPQLLKTEELSLAIISRYKPNLLEILTDRGLACDGSRIRMLFRRLQREVLFKGEYWTDHGMPAWMATISHYGLGHILEKCFLGLHKFQHFRMWTQKPLAEYITEVLLHGSKNMKEFFNPHQVERMIREHVAGKKNYIYEIDKLLTIILARSKLFKGGTYDSDTIRTSKLYFK